MRLITGGNDMGRCREAPAREHRQVRYSRWMTVRDMLTALQRLPRDAEVLAMEAGCDQYCEIELDDYLGPETRPSARPARVPQGPGPAWRMSLSSALQHADPRDLLVQPMLPPDSR